MTTLTEDSISRHMMTISENITVVKDFPKPGIFFRDISKLLSKPHERQIAFDLMAQKISSVCPTFDYVAGIDARGFIFGQALASHFKCGFVMLRKPSKMPNTVKINYGLEYGTNVLEIQQNQKTSDFERASFHLCWLAQPQ